MAMTEQAKKGGPLKLVWAVLFFGGLFAVLLGERVLLSRETLATVVSGVGLALCLASTVGRLLQSTRTTASGQIGRWLSAAQFVGVGALLIYWVNRLWLGVPATSSADIGVSDVLTVVWVGLMTVSVSAVLFGEWAIHGMRRAEHVESGRVRLAVQSGVALALTLVYGSLFVYAATQQEAKADFSYFKTSKPGEPTLKLVDQLGDKVTVTAFFPEVNEVKREVNGYLAELSKRNPALQVRVVDRYLEPKLADELKITRDGTLVIARDENRQTLNIGTELDKARATLRKLDQEVHGRLMKLLRDKKLAYLTTGHGELNDKTPQTEEGRSADIFKQVLEQGNLRLKELGLGEGLGREVPDDADLLVILGPTTPFTPEEIASVRRYAERGGKVFMALDTDVLGDVVTDATDRRWLEELAKAVGAKFVPTRLADEERYVVRRNNVSDRVILPTTRFSSHASVSTLNRHPSRGVVVLGASHLEKDPSSDVKADVAMRSFDSAFADTDGDYTRSSREVKREYTLAMAHSAPAKASAGQGDATDAAPEGANEMRAFVVADADVFSDVLMPRVPGNPILAFDAIRWLLGEESLAGQIQSEEDVRVEQTKQMNMAWFYSTVFGVPLAVLLGGVLISRRRGKSAASTKGANA